MRETSNAPVSPISRRYRAASRWAMAVSQSFGFVDRQISLDRMNMALRRMRAADDEAISLRQGLIDAKDDVGEVRAALAHGSAGVVVTR